MWVKFHILTNLKMPIMCDNQAMYGRDTSKLSRYREKKILEEHQTSFLLYSYN